MLIFCLCSEDMISAHFFIGVKFSSKKYFLNGLLPFHKIKKLSIVDRK
ncbi:hypothetical protein pb186bvf_000235 [Paramecium bursaria]